jgi:FkbM family methyltransferase
MMFMRIKRLLNKLGYDVKKYHPIFETTIQPLRIKTIIDIGANTGIFSVDMRNKFPEAMLYMFEPLADCVAHINESFVNDKNSKVFPIALGDTAGKTEIERSSFHPSSSLRHMSDLHKRLYPKTKDIQKEGITIDTLDHVLAEEPLPENILIKIDVQGFEDKVIVGGRNVISRAAAVIIETSFVSLYEGQPLFDDIAETMRGLGFSYYGDMGRHYSPLSGKLLYEDSLFMKKELISP